MIMKSDNGESVMLLPYQCPFYELCQHLLQVDTKSMMLPDVWICVSKRSLSAFPVVIQYRHMETEVWWKLIYESIFCNFTMDQMTACLLRPSSLQNI